MEDIKFLIKPENVSWDEIAHVVYEAHSSNRAVGVDIQNAHKTGDELKESLGDDGACFVAMKDGKVIATASVAFHDVKGWYHQGKAAYMTLAAVLPDYKGLHLYTKLNEMRTDYAIDKGVLICYGRTAAGNLKRRAIAKKDRYYEVQMGRTSYNPHYYVTIVKWLGEKPFSDFFIKYKFIKSEFLIKIKVLLGCVK